MLLIPFDGEARDRWGSLAHAQFTCLQNQLSAMGKLWGNQALPANFLQPRLIAMGNGLTALLLKFVQITGKLYWGIKN